MKNRAINTSAFIFTCLLIILLPAYTCAQDVSSSGKDFWLGYGAHAAMFNADGSVNGTGGQQEMRLYISAGSTANVTIEIPLLNWVKNVIVQGGSVSTEVTIPKNGSADARILTEGLSNKGIHISSNQEIMAYCHIYSTASSATSLLMPEELLGQEYYTLGAAQTAAEKNSFAYCFVVATEDGTTVEITPSAKTLSHAANVPFAVQLNRGQVYNIIGAPVSAAKGEDLTGTRIRTVSNVSGGACKKIAVFTGSSNTAVSCSATGSADNVIQQAPPYRAWGRSFFLIPTAKMAANRYRVLINQPTNVYVGNKQLTNLINNSYYEFTADTPASVFANKPVITAQFITSQGQCGNTRNGTNGDPEMIYLAPNLPAWGLSIISPALNNISNHYINVVLRTIAIDSFTLDNANVRSLFKPFPGRPAYSYAQIQVAAGTHNLHIDTLSFMATAYGYGPNESYGYNPFLYVQPLSNINIKNPYSHALQSNPCKTVPFNIVYTLRKKAAELIFDFGKNPNLSPNDVVDLKNPVPDSVYFKGTDTFYRYTLPAKYNYANVPSSNIDVDITEYIYTAEGCIEKRTVTYNIYVAHRPVAGITANYNTCGSNSVRLKDASTYADGYFTNWLWNFGDTTTATNQKRPVKLYTAYGDYSITLRSITNNGCFADTSTTVSLNPLPKASFKDTGIFCPQNNIQFTDSSTIETGWQIIKRTWFFGDGASSIDTNPVKQYADSGIYNVKLIATSNKNCADSITKRVIIYGPPPFKQFITVVNPVDTASVICSATPFKLSVTFTVRPVTIELNFSTNPSLAPNNTVTINPAIPDSAYFNGQDSFFRYTLPATYTFASTESLPVKITSTMLTKGGCIVPVIFNHNIQVITKPMAAWSLLYDRCANDTLNFKDASTAPGQNIKSWQWSFGDGTTATDASPIKKYMGYGEYPVTLHINTSAGCLADTAGTISLNPKPKAAFGFSAPDYCTGTDVQFADSSAVPAPYSIAQWLWNYGDGHTNGNQNTMHQFIAAGNFTVSLITTTNQHCADTATKPVTIYGHPAITLQSDVYLVGGNTLQLTPVYAGTGLRYLWQPPDYLSSDTASTPATSPPNDITYTIKATGDGGCFTTAGVTVHIEKAIEVPNAFSPNGDGINDTWRLTNIEVFPQCVVRLFNRYGQAVFTSTGYNKPWDGTSNGKPLPVGTYYYIIDMKSKIFPARSGSVTILR